MFYPADASELRDDVTQYIEIGAASPAQFTPKAIIAPHAGYMYSGPIAGTVYASLGSLRNVISRIIILGPSHRIGFRGIAGSSADAFSTPLGNINLDQSAYEGIKHLPHVIQYDLAHRDEHGIEVELPFLQVALDSFSIVPLIVGETTGEEVASVISALWGGPETLIVVSSDLSHYLTYNEAVKLDRQTSDSIEKLASDAIGVNQACGRLPIQGLLMTAREQHLAAQTLDLRNSGDTAGDKRMVVGYGAYVFYA